MLKIFIPTMGRMDKQLTLDYMKPVQDRVWLVVPWRERKLYSYKRVLATPPKLKGIGPTRQWILENAESDKIVMMDDDLRFFRRKNKKDWHLKGFKKKDTLDLYDWLDNKLDDYYHVSISPRQFNNSRPESELENKRPLRLLGYRREVLDLGCRFDRVPLMEDFDMALQLLELGYKNVVSFEFSQDQRISSHAPGGCSGYRTAKMQAKAARMLARLHPGFVTVKKKRTTSEAWKGLTEDQVRVDVQINWGEAYESSKERSLF